MIDETPEDHPDHKDIQEVHKIFASIVTQINERTRQVENVEQLTEINEKYKLSTLDIDVVSRDRELLQEDIISVYKFKSKKEIDDLAILLLFSDRIVLLHSKKEESGAFELIFHIGLTVATINKVEGSDTELQLVSNILQSKYINHFIHFLK